MNKNDREKAEEIMGNPDDPKHREIRKLGCIHVAFCLLAVGISFALYETIDKNLPVYLMLAVGLSVVGMYFSRRNAAKVIRRQDGEE